MRIFRPGGVGQADVVDDERRNQRNAERGVAFNRKFAPGLFVNDLFRIRLIFVQVKRFEENIAADDNHDDQQQNNSQQPFHKTHFYPSRQ